MGEVRVGQLTLALLAGIAAVPPTEHALPDGDEGSRVAVGAAPDEDVAVGGLDGLELVRARWVCHFVVVRVC